MRSIFVDQLANRLIKNFRSSSGGEQGRASTTVHANVLKQKDKKKQEYTEINSIGSASVKTDTGETCKGAKMQKKYAKMRHTKCRFQARQGGAILYQKFLNPGAVSVHAHPLKAPHLTV